MIINIKHWHTTGWLALVFLISGCYYDSQEAVYGIDDCSAGIPSYSNRIEPLILTNCTEATGCHNEGGHHPLLTSYEDISKHAKAALKRIQNGTMPKAGSGDSLTEEEKTQIFCWVNAGTPQN